MSSNSMRMFLGVWSSIAMVLAAVTLATDICPDACRCVANSTVVDCRNGDLRRIPWALPQPASLSELDLHGNVISEVISELASYTNLEYLDLSNNELLSLDDTAFDNLIDIKYIYLYNNKLEAVNARLFQGLETLLKLDLHRNELSTIMGGTFADLKNLEELDLSGNHLEMIEDLAFMGLPELHYAYLQDNLIEEIPVHSLQYTSKLRIMRLDYNQIESIPEHAFRDLRQLRVLNLASNNLVHVSDTAFHERDLLDVPSLEELNLAHNNLAVVPSKSLDHLTNLITLDISGNPISRIETDAFKGLDSLHNIHINSMPHLEIINNYAFAELSNLVFVEMHSNRMLGRISEHAFLATPNLRKVDLHANSLHQLNANTLSWQTLDELDLRYNPWNCDCHLVWMLRALQSLPTNWSQDHVREVRCTEPEVHAGVSIGELLPTDFLCPLQSSSRLQEHIIAAILAALSLALLITVIYLLHRTKYFEFNCPFSHRPQHSYQVHKNCESQVVGTESEENIVGDNMDMEDRA